MHNINPFPSRTCTFCIFWCILFRVVGGTEILKLPFFISSFIKYNIILFNLTASIPLVTDVQNITAYKICNNLNITAWNLVDLMHFNLKRAWLNDNYIHGVLLHQYFIVALIRRIIIVSVCPCYIKMRHISKD